MLIPIKTAKEKGIEPLDAEMTEISLKELGLKESDFEEFLRKNIEAIFGDEESLLIVGQQVHNSGGGRSDLTAIDDEGSIVLIELKRDLEDIVGRKESFEFQAIRYAASYANISTPEDLVDRVFARYIERHKSEYDLGELTSSEMGRRIINDFLERNKATKTFNRRQRIILAASAFDPQTLAAVSWLISNKVDICCFAFKPLMLGKQVFLQIEKILPPARIEDFYLDVKTSGTLPNMNLTEAKSATKRTFLPRMKTLIEWGCLKPGDKLMIQKVQNSEAEVIDATTVRFKGQVMTFNQWGQKATGWSAICIYEWAIHIAKGKSLDELRREKMEEISGNFNRAA